MTYTLPRRRVLQCIAASLCLPVLGAHAQSWPGMRTVRFITQSAAGDPVDIRMREFLKSLSPVLDGATLITDNKPGAGGLIAHQSMLNSPADGYSVLLANAGMTIIPTYFRRLPYNPLKDFTPVAFSGMSPIALAIPTSRTETNLKDWLQWARQQAGKLNYSSPGNGSVSHLYGFELAETTGVEATHVPYKGATPALLGLVAGDTQFMMLDIFSLRPMLARGSVRLLAVSGQERSKYLPDVATFKELGYPGFERMGWTAYYLRSGTPAPIVEKLAQAINQVNAQQDWEEKRKQIWSAWSGAMSPSALAQQLESETEIWAKVIRKAGVYAD